MQTKSWTKSEILDLLSRSQAAVERAILAIHSGQTFDEQNSQQTKHLNGIGWNAFDAQFGTSLANFITVGQTRFNKPVGTCLKGGQIAAASKLVRKYAGQLVKIANNSL